MRPQRDHERRSVKSLPSGYAAAENLPNRTILTRLAFSATTRFLLEDTFNPGSGVAQHPQRRLLDGQPVRCSDGSRVDGPDIKNSSFSSV